MIPTIPKNYENVVISTGNIINNELGQRKSNEELYDGLKITLLNDPKSESVVVEVDKRHGRVLCATQELNNKLTENERNEISIGAKIFLNKNSTECVKQAVEALVNILNVTHVDNVVLAYHPNVSNVASATYVSTTATPSSQKSPKAPCSESSPGTPSSSISNTESSWSVRNGAQGIAELKQLYKALEQYTTKQQIKQLGVADLDAKALEELYKSVEIPPTIAQVNLATCCVVPPELQEFCRDHEIVLNTHSDPELLLAEDKFSCLAPGFTIDWSLRYQVHVRCRGVLTAKGYIVGASQPSVDN